MAKLDTMSQLLKEHTELADLLCSLTPEQKSQEYIFGDWTVQDILVHITAWQWKAVEEINDLLMGREPWIVGADIDSFNAKEVAEKKHWRWNAVVQDWANAWAMLLPKMDSVPENLWDERTGFIWPDGSPLTIGSLFDYEYEGANHEGGHARQIKKHFAEE